jgi:hypothetical protein
MKEKYKYTPAGPSQGEDIVLCLKGRSHEIFTLIFWLEWIYIGLNENRYWFLYIKECSLILDIYFKY